MVPEPDTWLAQEAIDKTNSYLFEIAHSGIQDPHLQEVLKAIETRRSSSVRNKLFVKFGVAAACIGLVFITAVTIKSFLDENARKKAVLEEALQKALREHDWETVLELDPGNEDGEEMRSFAIDARRAAEEHAAEREARRAALEKKYNSP